MISNTELSIIIDLHKRAHCRGIVSQTHKLVRTVPMVGKLLDVAVDDIWNKPSTQHHKNSLTEGDLECEFRGFDQ